MSLIDLCILCVNVIHQEVPKDEWYCPNCRCAICDGSQFNGDQNTFNELTVLFCDQCERECKCQKELGSIGLIVTVIVTYARVSAICESLVNLVLNCVKNLTQTKVLGRCL